MDVRIQSIHFDASEQLQAFIQKKVSKLEKYYEDIKKVEVSLKVVKPETAEVSGSLPEIPCRRKRFFRGKSGTLGNYEEISEHGYGNVPGRNPKGFG